ncbi:MAG TPA: type VII secretion target [Mycobacterium sp.]|uniref:type VII secretion target n=1 Tax=Mycobacterium sp. TaxID=1785 RepID=UPI002D333AC9|nr:type VII secretion target [Mycobacterium sp.]HZU49565.1 type VII secretion target [Mycobacterium sp.]
MDQHCRTWIDVAAMRSVANRFHGAAEVIDDAVRNHLAHLAFSGASAGRAHAARGDAVRSALNRLPAQLTQWSRATVEIAAALRATADRYAEAELRAAAGIG